MLVHRLPLWNFNRRRRFNQRAFGPKRVKNQRWLHRRKSFSKFLECKFGIAVEVKPAHNCNEFTFQRLVAHHLEVSPKCLFIDEFVVQRVNGLEYVANREPFKSFDVLFKLLHLQLELNFVHNQVC